MATAIKRTTLPGTKPKRKSGSNRGRPRGSRNKFFDLKIEDAVKDLTIPLLQVDVERAMETKAGDVNDPENFLGCVIAQAGTRVCGAERVAILRQTAYVAYPGDNRARRYVVDEKSRAILEAWDRGEHIVEGVELVLRAPSKGRALTPMRRASRAWREKNPGKARKTHRKQRPTDPLHNVVRNGNLVRWS